MSVIIGEPQQLLPTSELSKNLLLTEYDRAILVARDEDLKAVGIESISDEQDKKNLTYLNDLLKKIVPTFSLEEKIRIGLTEALVAEGIEHLSKKTRAFLALHLKNVELFTLDHKVKEQIELIQQVPLTTDPDLNEAISNFATRSFDYFSKPIIEDDFQSSDIKAPNGNVCAGRRLMSILINIEAKLNDSGWEKQILSLKPVLSQNKLKNNNLTFISYLDLVIEAGILDGSFEDTLSDIRRKSKLSATQLDPNSRSEYEARKQFAAKVDKYILSVIDALSTLSQTKGTTSD